DSEISEKVTTEELKDNDEFNEYPIAEELAKQLENEYYFLENACLTYNTDANTWLDLANKIQSKSHYFDNKYQNEEIEELEVADFREPYTVDWLKENFDSFQAAKDYFGIKARGWGALAEYLNEEK
ncbi:MAG: hypothetical protein GVY04_00435, partial [Cyanobacteria bacterium]|nr:hypothetical protein [Cyanobacteria bacterium GSL.Bin1]